MSHIHMLHTYSLGLCMYPCSVVQYTAIEGCPQTLCGLLHTLFRRYICCMYICYILTGVQNKMALCACNHRFLSLTDKGQLLAVSEKAKEQEMVKVSQVLHSILERAWFMHVAGYYSGIAASLECLASTCSITKYVVCCFQYY